MQAGMHGQYNFKTRLFVVCHPRVDNGKGGAGSLAYAFIQHAMVNTILH